MRTINARVIILGTIVLCMVMNASHSYSNGVASGTNYVPIIRDCYLEGAEPHERIEIKRGEPIYPVQKIKGTIFKAYHGPHPPKGKYWIADSDNFAPLTDAIRSYRKFAWADAVNHLEDEIEKEEDCLVKTWKLIIKGHCYLHLDKIDAASESYREASNVTPENLFTPVALHVRIQLHYFQKDYEQTLSSLEYLVSNFPEYEGKGRNLLFNTYPNRNDIVDSAFLVDGEGKTIQEKYEFFTKFWHDLPYLDEKIASSTNESEIAKALYNKAVLLQELHDIFSCSIFSYLHRHSSESVEIYKTIVKEYPNSGWDDNAYFLLLKTRKHDWEGDDQGLYMEAIDFMEDFLKRYPNSELKETAAEQFLENLLNFLRNTRQ